MGAAAMATALVFAGPCVTYYEGVIPHTYADPVGIPTICTGHTGPDVTPGLALSLADCAALLTGDLRDAYLAAARCVMVPVEPWEAGAITSFTFNVGGHALCTSTLVRLLNAGAEPAVWCAQLTRWTYATVPVLGVKIQLPGLVKRRATERDMCMGRLDRLPG